MVDSPDGPRKEDPTTFYKLGVDYSITINPSDSHQYFGNPYRLKKFYQFTERQMLSTAGQYQLFLELSEPHTFKTQGYSGPRLHYHGIITFHTKLQLSTFLMVSYYLITRWAALEIDTIADPEYWELYVKKQRLIPKRYRTLNSGLQPAPS